MSSWLYHHHLPSWHPYLPDWHPHWEHVHEAASHLHWPRVPFRKPSGLETITLHGCLVFTNVVWSSLHILMSIPLRKGASPLVLALFREVIGFLALAGLAGYLDRGVRPPLTRRLVALFFLAGLLSALIRVTILQALENAGPNVTAAIVPATPVLTLVAGVMAGYEHINPHAKSGELQMFGLALCAISATQMALWRGVKMFGEPPLGLHAPANIPLGASFMLFNIVVSSATTIVMKKLLSLWPLLSITAAVEFFAVLWLALIAGVQAPAGSWWVDGSVVAASLFGGLVATAANSIFIARANKRLGPLVASMYVPVQPVTTALLDYLVLGDAFYLSGLLGATGIVGGLFLVKAGKVQALREIGEAHTARISQVSGGGDVGVTSDRLEGEAAGVDGAAAAAPEAVEAKAVALMPRASLVLQEDSNDDTVGLLSADGLARRRSYDV